MTTSDWTRCSSWHFLPGPYSLDGEVVECEYRATHALQRARYNAVRYGPEEDEDDE